MTSDYKRLGNYIRLVNNRNIDLQASELLGINIDKFFMPSVANIVGTDLRNYKLVKKGQFACNRMHVGRDLRIPIALSREEKSFIVSPAYEVFEIIDSNVLNEEYLMMWFSRREFDRNAWFYTDADVRGGLPWKSFCNIKIPVPSLEKQQEIVIEYNIILNRIKIHEALIQKLEETAQALYKNWFVDFEFPDENGKPYKSSGGEMVWNEGLGKEIPEGWEVDKIGGLFTLQRGHDLPTQNRINGEFPVFASTGFADFHNDYKIDQPTIITGRSGSLGELFYYDNPCWPLNTTLYIRKFLKATPFFSFYFLQTINLKELGSGSAVPTLNRNDIHALPKEFPKRSVMELFDKRASLIKSYIKSRELQIKKSEELKKILLSRLAIIKN